MKPAALRILWPAAAGAAVWFAVDPRGDFPLNDDWAYSGPVRRLAEEGVLRLSDWSSPLALPHLFAAALAAKIFGFHHAVLRLCTFAWSALAVYFLDRILASHRVSVPVRRLAAFAFFFHPVYFVMSFTFHTDVPFAALSLGAIWLFRRAELSGRPRDEWAASVFALGAGLTRQIGVLLPLSAAWRAFRERRASAARLARFALVPAAGLAACYAWFLLAHGPTWAHVNYVSAGTLRHAADAAGFLKAAFQRAGDSLVCAALFGLPLAFLADREKRRPSLRAEAALLAAGAAVLLYVAWRGRLPYLENVFHARGLGTLTVYDGRWKPAALWSDPRLWTLLTAAGAAGLWLALRRLAPLGPPAKEVLVYAAPLAAATLAGAKYFDRYLIVWSMAWTLVLAVRHGGARVPRRAWAAAGFWALASVAGARDYFAWNRAKWELASSAPMEPRLVAAGFDWNAHWKYEPAMAALKARKPLAEIGEWEWETLEPPRAFVSYRPEAEAPGRTLGRARYRSPLAPAGAEIHLYELKPPAPTAGKS